MQEILWWIWYLYADEPTFVRLVASVELGSKKPFAAI